MKITPLLELTVAALVIGFEQIVQWKFGAIGIMGLCLLGIGLKSRNSTCASVGAVLLVLLMARA
ncbi:hypothetical protein OG788_21885 [Streptomyces sp. NBC_00647]|uniref:hypothetical protein n=1 Tax=unclassified Streptomyces TaxID=2593676 RepID=UPI00325086BE